MFNDYTMLLANGELIHIKATNNKSAIKSAIQFGKVRAVRDSNNKLIYLNKGLWI